MQASPSKLDLSFFPKYKMEKSKQLSIPSPNFSSLLCNATVRQYVQRWLHEDTPNFDYGGFVVGEAEESAVLLCKSEGVLAGLPFFNAIFEELGCSVTWNFPEGVLLKPVCTVAVVKGNVNKILLGERLALNCLSRASGIASKAKRLAKMKEGSNWHGEIAGTRKTTPGFRIVEKYSLLIGGASTHRHDLSSMIMLKDNHIWTAGDINKAVANARRAGGFSIKIEVECRSVEEGRTAALAGADIIMLDNFALDVLHNSARILKKEFSNLLIEASGGIDEDNFKNYVGPYVDVISLGSLTQGYKTVDFSLKILKDGHDPHNPPVRS